MTARSRTTVVAAVAALLGVLVAVAVYLGATRAQDVAGGTPAEPSTASAATATALHRFYDQRIAWQDCEGGKAQCGRLEVPVDYAHPEGATIRLALLRVPARDQGARIGSLVVNPGGPGGSGVDYAAVAEAIVSPDVLARYDIVGFDPRGVARSAPVDCLTDRQLDTFVAADGSPDDPAEVAGIVRDSKALATGCATRTGPLLGHIGTTDVARDLDVLRSAVGDARLTYLGKSYGTAIGAEYARLFPEHIGRMVLDGVIDPRLSSEQFALGQARGFELALTAFLTDCVRTHCPLGSDVASARRGLQSLLARIDAAPLPTTTSRPLTQSLALLGIAFPLYLPASEGYPQLRDALQAAEAGDGAALLQLADAYLERRPNGTFDGNANEAIYAVNCLDRQEVTGPRDIERALPRFRAASPIFGAYIAWSNLPCAYWPERATGRAAAVRAPGAPPILVVGTTGDPATPYAWAKSLATQLDSGVLLTYEGAVHTAYRKGSGCIDAAVDAYLISGEVPPDGTRCN